MGNGPDNGAIEKEGDKQKQSESESESENENQKQSENENGNGNGNENESMADINDDDGGEWITPSNVSAIKARDSGMAMDGEALNDSGMHKGIKVACITSDFAMQNVLLQMGLHLLSFDGMVVKTLKSYVLRCHACFKSTPIMDKQFCPSCGNATLLRTTVSVDEQGEMHYHLKKHFQYRKRGTRFSIPMPHGGQKQDLIFREDQKEYQRAVKTQVRQKEKLAMASNAGGVFDAEYTPTLLEGNVYALEKMNLQKKALQSPTIGFGRRNPNEVRKRTGNKKRHE
jgi:RNA-binding protein NOB1